MSGDIGKAAQHPAAREDSPSDSAAEGKEHYVPFRARRAPALFSQESHLGIVVGTHGERVADFLPHPAIQANPFQELKLARQDPHEAGVGLENALTADSSTLDPHTVRQTLDQGVEDAPEVSPKGSPVGDKTGFRPQAGDPSIAIDNPGLDGRSANVDCQNASGFLHNWKSASLSGALVDPAIARCSGHRP